MLSKEEQLAADNRFRELCEDYAETKSKESWQEMWMIVAKASESVVKKMLKGVTVNDLDELILDTTCNVMAKLKKEFTNKGEFVLKNKLVTFCRSYALFPLYKPSKKFNDRVISLEGYNETHGDRLTKSASEED